MSQSENPFIHFHIPKTAGTSLRTIFMHQFGADRVAYMMPSRELVTANELAFDPVKLDAARIVIRKLGLLDQFSEALRNYNKVTHQDPFMLSDIVSRGVHVATGHFKHDDITADTAHILRTTILREPMSRAWSHYCHWREARGSTWWHEGTVPYVDTVAFETFVNDPHLINYQANILGDLDFAAIGVSENLPRFLKYIDLDPSDMAIPTLNPGDYIQPRFDAAFIRDFQELNSIDYELHEHALTGL